MLTLGENHDEGGHQLLLLKTWVRAVVLSKVLKQISTTAWGGAARGLLA